MAIIKSKNGNNRKLYCVVLCGIIILETTKFKEALKLASKINQ